MAITTIRSTFALDLETVRGLEEMARRWGVSKSEALRRSIRSAAGQGKALPNKRRAALDELQKSLGLSASTARAWVRQVRQERRASPAERR